MRQSPLWSAFDELVSNQRLEAAFELADRIREEALADPSREAELTEALIHQTQLRIALHGDAVAVRFLSEQQWPGTFLQRTILELFLGEALSRYISSYAWEIRRRPRIESLEQLDVEQMTAEQLFGKAMAAYQRIWSARSELGAVPATVLGSYLKQGDFPDHVRGTLRDLFSYQAVSLLSDTTHWRPEQAHDGFLLDLAALLAPSPDEHVALDDASLHPLIRACAVLGDLERWHETEGRRDAALEAFLERMRRLHGALTDELDRAAIEAHTAARLGAFGESGWWSIGQATLARFRKTAGAFAEAHALASTGAKATDVDGYGKKQCAALVQGIEQPEFSAHTRQVDGPERRSIGVVYKNLRKLYFRAFEVDLEDYAVGSNDYHVLPGYSDWQRIWQQRSKYDAAWIMDLPATEDFDLHTVFVTPPMKKAGLYVVLMSALESFDDAPGNRLCAASILLSDLVLLVHERGPRLEAMVLSGTNGAPVRGAKVKLVQRDYRAGHRVVAQGVTDPAGVFQFTPKRGSMGGYFVIASHKGQSTIQTDVNGGHPRDEEPLREVLLYTDRSIYRPEQTLHFKAILFTGGADRERFCVAPGQPLEVLLEDTNGEIVARQDVTTNAFGSASGAFVVPAGRLLGRWTLRTASHGGVHVRVEEYKRPTFEVTLPPPAGELRLNAPARIEGRARYYFGTAVSGGKVTWKVERAPRVPPWWFWGGIDTRPVRVASGTAALAPDGTFHVEFTPQVDPRKARVPGISFLYDVQVDVTDDGGETRTAHRRFRLGHVAVESAIELDNEFALADAPLRVRVVRRDLDGNARPGQGGWKLVAVEQPAGVVPGPADLPPPPRPEGDDGFRLPSDDWRARWNTQYGAEQVMAAWPDGAVVGQGQMVHGEDGGADLVLPPLKAGVYRLHYETRDEQGNRHTGQKVVLSVAASTPVALPAIFEVESSCVRVGGVARAFVASGTTDQILFLDLFQRGERVERRVLSPGDPELIEWTIDERARGGFGLVMFAVRDFQLITISRSIYVPRDDKELSLTLSTFRDTLRPGGREAWRLVVRGPGGGPLPAHAAEVLAYMYDRSLEVFAKHTPPEALGWYASNSDARVPIGPGRAVAFGRILNDRLCFPVSEPRYYPAAFLAIPRYGIGGPGARSAMMFGGPGGPPPPPAMAAAPAACMPAPAPGQGNDMALATNAPDASGGYAADEPDGEASLEMRSNFAESAFFLPHLVNDADGTVAIEFDVPDSVTEWAVWFHAITRDFVSGVLRRDVRTIKELMVRPYVPRFLREGDEAELRVMVTNASGQPMSGRVRVQVMDVDTGADIGVRFGLGDGEREFEAAPGGGATVAYSLLTPHEPGTVAFRVEARSGERSDGELRPIPVLPSRVHLAQSRFVTLRGAGRRTMQFEDMARDDDPTLKHDGLVVSVDAQLFYTVLKALPYLVEYPYECCEQVLNRFVSSSIVGGVFESFPTVAAMARSLPKRETPIAPWAEQDPNRRMVAEETPWLREARGGDDPKFPLVDMLDARVVAQHRDKSLAQLEKAQTSSGGFPWFPGGRPSPFITLYVLEGMARALEFGVRVPESLVRSAWAYLTRHFRADIFPRLRDKELPPPAATYLLYTLHAYKDASMTAGAFTDSERAELLGYGWNAWRDHAPMLKLQLALTLHRVGRESDARTVLEAVMDSARTEADRGTFWAAEARSWLWYNDTTETHAFALRTLGELIPDDPRRDGLVLWLLLDKKLNQWKSTKATAAAIYALVHHMSRDGTLGVREDARVRMGDRTRTYAFEPHEYTGRVQWVLAADQVEPRVCSTITVEKESPGFLFASSTWHFSTERAPEASGDFFHVTRTFYKRVMVGDEPTLHPLQEGAELEVGDEVEVHLSIRAGHGAEYVHLRDPRPAGFEPDKAVSGWRYDLGPGCYEEVRDSGMNFFFEWLPTGEYTLRHRMRAAMGGRFRAHPATLQSMYAPEFCAYSSGAVVSIAT